MASDTQLASASNLYFKIFPSLTLEYFPVWFLSQNVFHGIYERNKSNSLLYIELCLEKATRAFEISALWVRKLRQVLRISLILTMVDFIIWDDKFSWREDHQAKYYWKINLIHNFASWHKGKHIYRSNCLSSIRIICYHTILKSGHCLFSIVFLRVTFYQYID